MDTLFSSSYCPPTHQQNIVLRDVTMRISYALTVNKNPDAMAVLVHLCGHFVNVYKPSFSPPTFL